LRSAWQDWYEIVRARASGETTRYTEVEYQVLYSSLMRMLAGLRATSRSGRTALYDQMQALVEPWLNLRALAGLDRKSLLSLWTSCQRLDAEFLPSRRTGFPTWIFAVAFLVGLGILLGCVFVARGL